MTKSIFLFLFLPFFLQAQSAGDLIPQIKDLMLERYIFLDKAREVNAHLDQLLGQGYFDTIPDADALARALTREMRVITNDGHLWVGAPRATPQRPNPDPAFRRVFTRYANPMIREIKYLESNVGYLEMRYFGGGDLNHEKIDAAMRQLRDADALIIDLRRNGGGSIKTVGYFCSYFFDQDMLLNSIYSRFDDHTEENRVVEVNGMKVPDLPVFILTSSRTFSGAEDFSYTLQSFDRATIIGDTTGGGAHPTRSHEIEGGFRVGIPFARSISPVTGSNWEGTGVIPDEPVPSDEALERAIVLATEASLERKDQYFEPLMMELKAMREGNASEGSTDKIYQSLKTIVEAGMIHENDINRFGYHYLRTDQLPAALAILGANSQLFPESANVADSYAEALAENGQANEARAQYRKAVALAKAQSHPDLEFFQRNLSRFENQEGGNH